MHNQAVVIRSPSVPSTASRRPVCTRRPTGAGGVSGWVQRRRTGTGLAALIVFTKHSRLAKPRSTLPAAERPNSKLQANEPGSRQFSAARPICICGSASASAAPLAANKGTMQSRCWQRKAAGRTACLRASGCSGQEGARCVSLCLHHRASTGAHGTQRPLQHREAF